MSIKAIQSHIISQPVKLLLNIVLQEFEEYKYTMVEELHELKLEHPSKYNEG